MPKFCGNCGQPLINGAPFCGACGFNNSNINPSPEPEPIPQRPQRPMRPPAPTPRPQSRKRPGLFSRKQTRPVSNPNPYPYDPNDPYGDSFQQQPYAPADIVENSYDDRNINPMGDDTPTIPIRHAPRQTPNPQPTPRPQPVPAPQPIPKPQPVPTPQPTPKPQPVPAPQPIPKPQPAPRPQPTPELQQEPFLKPQPTVQKQVFTLHKDPALQAADLDALNQWLDITPLKLNSIGLRGETAEDLFCRFELSYIKRSQVPGRYQLGQFSEELYDLESLPLEQRLEEFKSSNPGKKVIWTKKIPLPVEDETVETLFYLYAERR